VRNVVLTDDHPVVRRGLRALLEAEADLHVVAESGNGLETIQLVERLQPDILVLDLMIEGISGIEVARQVSKRSPSTSIVILSMYSNEAYVVEALQAGAKAYVLKDSTSEELVHAINEVATGHRYLSQLLSERAINLYIQKTQNNIFDPYDKLTTREREVLHLAAHSCSNSEIAAQLFISRRTVEVHRSNMMGKLGLHSQDELLRYASRKGIIILDS